MMMNLLGWVIVGLMVCALWRSVSTGLRSGMPASRNRALMGIIISVNVMSVLDATSTIYLLANNHSGEMNPLMNALIQRSYLLFFAFKFSLTMIATLVCWHYYGRKRRARSILRLTTRIYCALIAWHCLLLSSVLI